MGVVKNARRVYAKMLRDGLRKLLQYVLGNYWDMFKKNTKWYSESVKLVSGVPYSDTKWKPSL